ncbi:HEAT repeat domain-containing protein [Streptosporangium sp. G11]|uniref:HEAT repeat domain-containing protein n=1 Tax=Streptosporangium sp. G11 TaxID=3436926 RepID=UPI003EB90722
MNEEDARVILSMGIVPNEPREGTPDDILRHFGTNDGHELGLRLIKDAVRRKDGYDVALAMMVCHAFGYTMDHFDVLVELSYADWHKKHEDVVSNLGKLKAPAAVEALYHATQWIPDYLDYDDDRTLASKAIWALGGTPGPEAERALVRLADSENEMLKEEAGYQLERRGVR